MGRDPRCNKVLCKLYAEPDTHTHLPNGPWTEEFMVQDSVSEDCLFLNIWTPAKTADDKLATLVYIHGGAFNEGSGSIDVYNGEELAKKGIIVVTINYRLGALGSWRIPKLTAESPHHASGNYGLLDQIAASEVDQGKYYSLWRRPFTGNNSRSVSWSDLSKCNDYLALGDRSFSWRHHRKRYILCQKSYGHQAFT